MSIVPFLQNIYWYDFVPSRGCEVISLVLVPRRYSRPWSAAILQQNESLAFLLVTLGSLCCDSPVFQAQVRYGVQSGTLPVSLLNTS